MESILHKKLIPIFCLFLLSIFYVLNVSSISAGKELHFSRSRGQTDDSCFRAAVFEHYQDASLPNWQEMVKVNLETYDKVAKRAAESGAKIIVFPENGVLLGTLHFMLPGLIELKDPKELGPDNNNPCLDEKADKNGIMRKLSCIARDNKLYVVANFPTKQICNPQKEDRCPERGFFVLNYSVVFTSDGTYIVRYGKANLLSDSRIFNRSFPAKIEYFDTPFGRFGLVTGSDIIFKTPAIDLIEQFNVSTIIFPSFWFDELPLLSSIQLQEGWSAANNVSLLASSLYRPSWGSVGSGIYSDLNSVYSSSKSKQPKLIIATIPTNFTNSTSCSFDPKVIDIERKFPEEEYYYGNYQLIYKDDIHVFTNLEESKTVCVGLVCCSVDFKISESSAKNGGLDDKLILFVRSFKRQTYYKWYEEACSLATLSSPFDGKHFNRNRFSSEALFNFERLSMNATFKTKYVFPVTAYNVSNLVAKIDREFDCQIVTNGSYSWSNECKLNITKTGEDKRIYSFGFYGREYDSDTNH